MTLSYTIHLPLSSDINTRIAWAGDMFHNLIEGQLTANEGWYIWNALVGWTDLCSANERRQYEQMARIYQDYLRNQ
jgi:hypothetical protein